MAKRKTVNSDELSNPLKPTKRLSLEPEKKKRTDRTVPVGVGLKQSELDEFEEIADMYGVTRHNLMRWALRYFLKLHRDGEITLGRSVTTPEPKNELVDP